jgi:RNA polymerase sigma-70 factor (ECF subfamily)
MFWVSDEVICAVAVSPSPTTAGSLTVSCRRMTAGVELGTTQASEPSDLAPLSPEQLAERSKAGCQDSFESLVEHFAERIFNFLLQMTRSRHDAEDLTQETFLKAYQNIHRYNPAYSFATWLFTIAKRTAISHFRAARPTEEIPENSAASDADPSVVFAQKDERRSLWQLAETLKPKQFEALWLRYGEGFTIAEVARIMKITRIHVKVLLHRGRQHLAELVTGQPHEPARKKNPDRKSRSTDATND